MAENKVRNTICIMRSGSYIWFMKTPTNLRERILNPMRLQLDYTPEGDRCIYCNADAYRCEHYEDAEREARLDAQAEYEDQIRYEREAFND